MIHWASWSVRFQFKQEGGIVLYCLYAMDGNRLFIYFIGTSGVWTYILMTRVMYMYNILSYIYIIHAFYNISITLHIWALYGFNEMHELTISGQYFVDWYCGVVAVYINIQKCECICVHVCVSYVSCVWGPLYGVFLLYEFYVRKELILWQIFAKSLQFHKI